MTFTSTYPQFDHAGVIVNNYFQKWFGSIKIKQEASTSIKQASYIVGGISTIHLLFEILKSFMPMMLLLTPKLNKLSSTFLIALACCLPRVKSRILCIISFLFLSYRLLFFIQGFIFFNQIAQIPGFSQVPGLNWNDFTMKYVVLSWSFLAFSTLVAWLANIRAIQAVLAWNKTS